MTTQVPIPASKSLTQRALILAALADRPSEVYEPLDCDDSRHLRRALASLGARFDAAVRGHSTAVRVTPATLPLRTASGPLFCGNAGTAVRFLAPLSLACDGPLVIDGDARMRRRPIAPLVESLEELGVTHRYLGERGFPPVELHRTRATPSRARVATSVSSQFASGLLLVAPLLEQGLELELTGPRVSRPYLDMTVATMRAAGCAVSWLDETTLRVEAGRPRGRPVTIERDWSAAAFMLVAARITNADILVKDLCPARESLQGDAVIESMLESLDGSPVNEFDLTDAPDLLAPLTVAALFARQSTRIRGAAHARVKECDRIAVLAREFRRIGAKVVPGDDGLDVEPLARSVGAEIALDPEDDHRMAMAFAVASLRLPEIRVCNPACVSKSFPEFWESLGIVRRAASEAKRL